MDNRILESYLLLAIKESGLILNKKEINRLIRGYRVALKSYPVDVAVQIGEEWYNAIAESEGLPPKRERKILTSLPNDYQSELSKENEKLIKLLRSCR